MVPILRTVSSRHTAVAPLRTTLSWLHGVLLMFSLLVVSWWGTTTEACSPTGGDFEEPLMEQLAHHYDHIFYGKVLNTYIDHSFDYGGGSRSYTATLKVWCIYKGDQVAPLTNISEVGIIPGHCHSTELLLQHRYLVMAKKANSTTYKILDSIDVGDAESSKEMYTFTRACGLSRKYPPGVLAEEVRCMEPAGEDTCITKNHGPSYDNNAQSHSESPRISDDTKKHQPATVCGSSNSSLNTNVILSLLSCLLVVSYYLTLYKL